MLLGLGIFISSIILSIILYALAFFSFDNFYNKAHIKAFKTEGTDTYINPCLLYNVKFSCLQLNSDNKCNIDIINTLPDSYCKRKMLRGNTLPNSYCKRKILKGNI